MRVREKETGRKKVEQTQLNMGAESSAKNGWYSGKEGHS